MLWIASILCLGLLLAFTRVGVGAHFPIDVISGSIFGFISGVLGIILVQRFSIFGWVGPVKYYPIFILLLVITAVTIIIKIVHENLFVFYLALASLGFSLFKITQLYVQKKP